MIHLHEMVDVDRNLKSPANFAKDLVKSILVEWEESKTPLENGRKGIRPSKLSFRSDVGHFSP
jgi:hypothetical protein